MMRACEFFEEGKRRQGRRGRVKEGGGGDVYGLGERIGWQVEDSQGQQNLSVIRWRPAAVSRNERHSHSFMHVLSEITPKSIQLKKRKGWLEKSFPNINKLLTYLDEGCVLLCLLKVVVVGLSPLFGSPQFMIESATLPY